MLHLTLLKHHHKSLSNSFLPRSFLLSWILCAVPAHGSSNSVVQQQPQQQQRHYHHCPASCKISQTAFQSPRRCLFRSSTSSTLHSTTTTSTTCNSNMKPQLWQDGKDEAMAKTVLPLSPTSYKGSSGRVAILGGSARYTGAPFYAAMACLKAGADLAYVFTAQEAALPIKCYSPELMVAPVYTAAEMDAIVKQQQNESSLTTTSPRAAQLVEDMVQQVVPMMERLHCMVIGPGLGRCPLVFTAVAKIIKAAKLQGLHLVLDADALYMLSLPEYRFLLKGYTKAILTPNVVEYKRLVADSKNDAETDPLESVTIIQKGRHDQITMGTTTKALQQQEPPLYICAEEGGLKRSGGIGDILAGTVGTLAAWHSILLQRQQRTDGDDACCLEEEHLALACWTACCFVKQSTRRAYQAHGRAMTAPDVLDELGPTIDAMTRTEASSEG